MVETTERNVQSKKRKVIRSMIRQHSSVFRQHSSVIRHGRRQVFPPGISYPFCIFPEGDFLCLGYWLGTRRPCAVLHAQ